MDYQPEFKSSNNQPCSIDALCAITHPMRQYLHIDYLDYTRINGRFAIPSSKLLNISVILLILDCIGNSIKSVEAIKAGDVTKAQENLTILGLTTLFAVRGFSLAQNLTKISKLFNDIDCIFPHSEHLQEQMEVAKSHHYIKRRFFVLHTILTMSVVIFSLLPLGKFFIFYDFDEKPSIDEDFHADPSWMPFGLKDRLSTYGFIYFYEIAVIATGVNMIMAWDQVFVITISQLCMYYEYLAKLLLNMDVRDAKDPRKEEAFFKKLHLHIFIHQYLNILGGDIKDTFSLSILISHMATAMSICFDLFLLSEAKDYLSIATYLFPCIVEISLLYDESKWGTLLETVTSRINEVLYEQKWYESSIRCRKYTMMWMQSTNEPLRISAFNVFNVNMKHFQDMMMLAYQMLTFMKSKS